ncbi:VPS10 domain-containing protein [Fimbriimonas ginsengisoli]|uniref:BNR repeat-containing glycosyl hydrolase n=1 Tax=Fimbriimonas ginsengisoli Gsoil 348 TaxID=661478 RepID=A0A068NW35_FIMGI|nr:hypothetical protein [Fimbriimonas ginsengisoli]AIE87542.1 BNR repeat-containing glycosyl hydrolase [Fimbriimonas ginsengisoli Gsoil 348]
MKTSLALAALFIPLVTVAQTPPQTSNPSVADILAPLEARSLGPVNMGGRVVAISVYEKDPRIFFVASASGGLFRTENGGTTFKPIFQSESSVSLGAVSVSQTDPNVIWVGTGEYTSRNSVAWGDGVYKTTDGGKTWANMGLKETMHIGKIALDPHDPNTVYVAALGRLWGPNPERGVYKTTDGGKTWQQVLSSDANTGAIDVQLDPRNPKVLFASMWERRRWAYDFSTGGVNCGLFKSTDSGKHWRRISRGLPSTLLGRIGFTFYDSDPKVMMATVEYKIDADAEKNDKPHRPSDNGIVKQYAGGTFWSTDGGESWKRISYLNPRPWYFSTPRIDPVDTKRLYVPGDSLFLSDDGGKTFDTADVKVHPDFHAFWIEPRDHNHLLVGTDGGVFESRDKGATWAMLNGLPIGQFYAVAFDYRKPYWIYGGLQDNGCWGIPTQTTKGGVAFYDSLSVGGGDGFYCQADPNDWSTIYTESQGGAISRFDLEKGGQRGIRPRGQGNRFNWSTPFIISPHNSRTLYLGGNRLFKTINRGDAWKPISPDLTTNDPGKQNAGKLGVTSDRSGAEMHCTIVTISESPTKPGLIYVGTDDGLVQVTQDDGATWTEIGKNVPDLPRNTWCSRVTASKYEEGRVYATFDGHRGNDFKPYVYVSEDFGKTWTKLNNGLPDEDNVYVITEGEKNSDLLYLGSEKSLRFSLDRGKTWTKFKGNFPTVAVHDLKVHPRELDLIIGTHGRGLWTLDVSGLEQLDKDALSKDVVLAKPQNVLMLGRVSRAAWEGDRLFMASNTQPGTRVQYYLRKAAKSATVRISDASGNNYTDYTGGTNAGLNLVEWSGRIEGRLVDPGDYRVVLTVDGKEYATSVHVDGVASVTEPARRGDEDGDGDRGRKR